MSAESAHRLSPTQELVQPGDGAGRDPNGGRRLQDPPHHRARRGRHCNDDLVDGVLSHDLGNVVESAGDGDAMEPPVLLRRVIVDERDWARTEAGVGRELARHHRSGGTGTCDEDATLSRLVGPSTPGVRTPTTAAAHRESWKRDHQRAEERVDQYDRDRNATVRCARHQTRTEIRADPHHGEHGARRAEVLEIRLSGVAPESRIQAHPPKHEETEGHRDRDIRREHDAHAGRKRQPLEAREERHCRRSR